ncbi:MAG: formate--tetrahydrofolate ligase, partial [Flavobacteriaceae bacterium]|nr:formate--tetrahydrofolate ligase [Flavobacteriaceae bacterium]
MKTDIEIARSIPLEHISKIAEKIGIPEEKLMPYGRYI